MLNTIVKSIQVEGSHPDTHLVLYLQENSPEIYIKSRPMILICPGGGYRFTSDREADAMALKFLSMGYHAAILRYSVAPARFPTALLELASSVNLIRENAAAWNVEADKLYVLGCSAGGHLAASLGVMWDRDFVRQALGLSDASLLRPDGLILCYPVITSGEFAHRGSFENLLGNKEAELLDEVSLEKHVTGNVPPCFIWHTFADATVPVENSLLFVSALRKAGIPTEFHMYPKGGHGLGLASKLTMHASGTGVQEECTSWINLVYTWIESRNA